MGKRRIERIRCFAVQLPLIRPHVMSHGRVIPTIASTIVEVTDDEGCCGYGESTPLSGSYIDGFVESQRAGVARLAPVVAEVDPMAGSTLNTRMDEAVIGHPTAKAVVDAALWDLRGKILGSPVVDLLGGKQVEDFPSFEFISYGSDTETLLDDVQRSMDAGYRHWQFKVGNDPVSDAKRIHMVLDRIDGHDDYVALDANRGWPIGEATRFLQLLGNRAVYIEQPCETMEELAQLRQRFPFAFIADECVRNANELIRSFTIGAADAVSLKPARIGGPTKTAFMSDIAISLGYKMLIDEPLGGQLADAAMAHLSARIPEKYFLAATNLTGTRILREDQPWLSGEVIGTNRARVTVPDRPGWGVDIDPAGFPGPVFEWRA